MSTQLIINQLESYSLEHPQEVLVIHASIDHEEDEVVIFKGFSSSLMRSTAYDLDVMVLPEQAEILAVDRLEGPLNPNHPKPIELGIAWADFKQRLGVG